MASTEVRKARDGEVKMLWAAFLTFLSIVAMLGAWLVVGAMQPPRYKGVI